MDQLTCTYRPRRTRSETPPPLQITERDTDILRLVAEYRFLNSEHIRRLVTGSAKNLSNRLKGLFEHGFLDRPQCQYEFYRPGGGSQHIVYAPTDKGIRLLANNPRTIRKSGHWANKNKSVGQLHLKHSLAIADFAVSMKLAVRGCNDIDLIDGSALLTNLPTETQSLAKPYRLNVPVIHQGRRTAIGLEPDYTFSLSLTKAKRQAFFFVEVDRGTMPIERASLGQTSILRKLLAYQSLWQSKQHQQHFGWRSFRVLFVTTSAERADNMIKATDKHTAIAGSSLFLFTDKQSLYAQEDLLAHQWHDSRGNIQTLLPQGLR